MDSVTRHEQQQTTKCMYECVRTRKKKQVVYTSMTVVSDVFTAVLTKGAEMIGTEQALMYVHKLYEKMNMV